MARHSYISSLANVKVWFDGLGRVHWNLYRGHQDRLSHGKMIYKQIDGALSIDESWDLLHNLIEMNSESGGQFTIYVPDKVNGNQGNSVYVGINMTLSQQPNLKASVSGVPQSYLGMVPAEKVQEEIQKEKRLWVLERQLEDMEAAQDAGLGISDILKDQLRGIDLNPLIAGLVAHFAPRVPGVQLQGTPEDHAQPAEEKEQSVYAYDGQRLKPILDVIRPEFETEEEFYNFLIGVANMFSSNPQFFKNQFSNG